MPHRKVVFEPDAYYHLYNRGNNYRPIFFERENYLFFLRQIRKYLAAQAVEVIAYCLMPNHYHLLVYLVTGDLSDMMQAFSLSYTKAINARNRRVGSLFQGRFKAIHVDRETYLLHLARYIHLNPVAAGLVTRAEEWEFSSYREFIGLRHGTLCKPGIVLSQLGSQQAYRVFVEDYVESNKRMIEHLTLD